MSSTRFFRVALPLAAAALLAAGCAEQVTRYGDAKGVETVTNEFGSTDHHVARYAELTKE